MRNQSAFLLLVLLLVSCKHPRKVNTSFYYWKTVYKQNTVENAFLQKLHTHTLYIHIMDVDMDDSGTTPVPVSPISFRQKLPDTVAMVPVVYIINNVLKILSKTDLAKLAHQIIFFTNGKAAQAGKKGYAELQIDCDWTAETRDNYFYLLQQLKAGLQGKTLSVTLRLHQVKNQKSCGIPPVNKALLMCYNMGNLREYGPQNSIIEISELKKYIGDNLNLYPMTMDIGLPLFSWAVAFRDKAYIGIARHIHFNILFDSVNFIAEKNNLYLAKTDLPQYGLQKHDEVRWESTDIQKLYGVAKYIAPYLQNDNLAVVYFHLDEDVLKKFNYEQLENVGNLLR